MDLLKKFYDKLILGILLLALIGVMTIQSCSMKETRFAVEQADTEMEADFSSKLVTVLDKKTFHIDIGKDDSLMWDTGFVDGDDFEVDEQLAKYHPLYPITAMAPGRYMYSMSGKPFLMYYGMPVNTTTQEPEIPFTVVPPPEDDDNEGSGTSVLLVGADSDNDGMPDKWEKDFGLDQNDPRDAKGDLDKDQFSNHEEFTASTNPENPKSYPLLITRLRWKSKKTKALPFLLQTVVPYPPDDKRNWQIHMNVGGTTRIHKLGQNIHETEYKLVEVHYEEIERIDEHNIKRKRRVFEVQVQRENGDLIRVHPNKRVPESEPAFQFILLYGKKPFKQFLVKKNVEFELKSRSGRIEKYKITEESKHKLTIEGKSDRHVIRKPNSEDKKRFFRKKEERRFEGNYEGFGKRDSRPDGFPAQNRFLTP
ncbi:MAG: hypothetical protein QGF67_00350 [Lentisphaeria bacterium]|nr:hypothetical protein [Lentisphaeria bacterium]